MNDKIYITEKIMTKEDKTPKKKKKSKEYLEYETIDLFMQHYSGLSKEEYQKRRKIEKAIEDIVYAYPTKHKEGFTREEINTIAVEKFKVNPEDVYKNIGVVTCMAVDGETIIYASDISVAMKCTVMKRKPNSWEFD
jgi:diketogulonate reductase-like aldo/keto reductase